MVNRFYFYKIFFIIIFVILIIVSEYISNQSPVNITKKFKEQENLVNLFIRRASSFSRLVFILRDHTYTSYFYPMKKGKVFKSDNINEMLTLDGFIYKNEFLNEEVKISIPICHKYGFFYSRGALENVFLSKERDERIVDFKEESIKLKTKGNIAITINTVCFLLKSGMVLQVANISEINEEISNGKIKKPNYKIIRIFFVGKKISRKDFPNAEIREHFD